MGEGKRKDQVKRHVQKTKLVVKDFNAKTLESGKRIRKSTLVECRLTVSGQVLRVGEVLALLDRRVGRAKIYKKVKLIGEVTDAGQAALESFGTKEDKLKGSSRGCVVHTTPTAQSEIFLVRIS